MTCEHHPCRLRHLHFEHVGQWGLLFLGESGYNAYDVHEG